MDINVVLINASFLFHGYQLMPFFDCMNNSYKRNANLCRHFLISWVNNKMQCLFSKPPLISHSSITAKSYQWPLLPNKH